MHYTIERNGKSNVTIKFVVDGETSAKTFAGLYAEAAKQVRIPGFRSGKAPLQALEKHLIQDALKKNAAEEMMAVAYAEAVEEENLIAYKPVFHYDSIKEGEKFTFTADVALKPVPVIGQYKGLELSAIEIVVDEKAIDNKIKELMAKLNTVKAVDTPIQSGDLVRISYKGTIDGVPFAGGSEDHTLSIEAWALIPGFAEQLIGHQTGDVFEVSITFPEVYLSEELQGKNAVFAVEIKEVCRKKEIEINDQTIQEISEFATVQELREAIREQLEGENESEARIYLEKQAVEKLLGVTEVEIPGALVEERLNAMLAELEANRQRRGLKLADYLKNTGKSLKVFREQLRNDAAKEIKAELALLEVAKKEGIRVSEAEIKAEIKDFTAMTGKSPDDVVKTLVQEGSYQAFVFSLLRQKTTQFLIDNAEFIDNR
jgi:trigger factor